MKAKFWKSYKLSAILITFSLVFLFFFGCERDEGSQNNKRDFGPFDPDVVTANTKFGFNLFNEIQKNDQDRNISSHHSVFPWLWR